MVNIKKNPYYKLDEAADRAKQRAVANSRKTILNAGDDDQQITLALQGVLDDPSIRPYYHRIIGNRNSEAAQVGIQAVQGMRTLVDIVAKNEGSGGRSKQCRSLLQTIVMCLMSGVEDPVSKNAILRQILPSLSRGAAYRLMDKAGEKRKRLEAEELSEFKMVEEEENRCKYTFYEKEALINWMCDNLYTRQSPNAKDTIRKRDINSELESCKSVIMEQYRPYSNLSLHTCSLYIVKTI